MSKQFASTLGIPSEAGSLAGTISIGAAMRPIQIDQIVRGETKSMVMPPMQHAVGPGVPNLVPGPDVIVGDVEDVAQFDPPVGTQVGLAIGTDSCNNGDQPIDWFALPQHRSSGRSAEPLSHERRRKQRRALRTNRPVMDETYVPGIGRFRLRQLVTPVVAKQARHLCPGCSDPYMSGLNGDQNSIGSRAWVNPFTGSFPSKQPTTTAATFTTAYRTGSWWRRVI